MACSKMRDLAEQYSRDVQAVWRIGGHRRPSLSCSRASPASHDGTPSVAPSVTSPTSSSEAQTAPEVPDALSHAPKRRKQLPDAAAAPRERLASAPHPPLPPLPLLPPAASLLLPPILSGGADCTGAAPTNNAAPRQPPPPAKPAVRREPAAKPMPLSTPMVTIPTAMPATTSASVATSESAATPPAAESSPISVATPASDATPTAATPNEQDESDDYSDENQFAGINMKALKQRGKGKYYCPRGHHCDKGGVDKQGNLVLFDRNSSFAYVAIFPHPARGDEPSSCVSFLARLQVSPTPSDH